MKVIPGDALQQATQGPTPAQVKASNAAADPAWVCDHCGNTVSEWSVVCGKCESFDSFRWRTPPSIVSLPEGETANSKLITEGQAALPTGGIEAG